MPCACATITTIQYSTVHAVQYLAKLPSPDSRSSRVELSEMPPKKKLKLTKGQQILGISSSTSRLEVRANSDHGDSDYPAESSSSGTVATFSSRSSSESSSSNRRGTTASWRSFGESKWRDIHAWLLVRDDGVYCKYCTHFGGRSGVFVSKPYTGNRPDKLARHGSCGTHIQNQLKYQEWQTRVATSSTVTCMMERGSWLAKK